MMHPKLQAAFNAEVRCANQALTDDRLDAAFLHFERAQVLGQWYARPHVMTHLGMLRIGWRRRDLREIFGQLLRTPGGMIGSATDQRISIPACTAGSKGPSGA